MPASTAVEFDIDMDDNQQEEQFAAYRQQRSLQTRAKTSARHTGPPIPVPVPTKGASKPGSNSSSHSRQTRPSSSSASLSLDNDVDDEEDLYDDDHASQFAQSSSSNNLSSSFCVDSALQATAHGRGDVRDSLMVSNQSPAPASNGAHGRGPFQQSRSSEYGSAVMRMDEGYRSSSVKARRSAATGHNASADGLTPLLQAARSGDLVLLNSLIIQPGTDVLRRDPVYGQTALHFAIRGGHLACVQALVMPELAGSIVNVPDSRRNTALHLAAAKSRRMAKVLIDAGADVNFLNMRNQTPLGVHILTVTKDEPTMTEILLQARADPNAPVDRSTALHVALDKGHFQIAQRLVRHGARLDLTDESGKMVFDKLEPAMLKVLLGKVNHAPVWIPDDARSTCMECNKKFGSLGTRRHHCRFCGRLVCAKCSNCQIKGSQLPFRQRRKKDRQDPKKKQRVCTTCYEILMEGDLNARDQRA